MMFFIWGPLRMPENCKLYSCTNYVTAHAADLMPAAPQAGSRIKALGQGAGWTQCSW